MITEAGRMIKVQVNGDQTFQTIDGFGVNINSKHWKKGQLIPTMDVLLEDLGATLYRVDIWGKSDWVDPQSSIGPASLHPENLARIYQGDVFQDGWGMLRYLNQKGIRPYLTASGDVPRWMLASDGKTLADYESFCEMLASLLEWAVIKERLSIGYFCPLNETDIGSPEGPCVSPVEYVKVCELLDGKLHQRGLDEIKFVVAEQSGFTADYLREFVHSHQLLKRIGVFSMHDYADLQPESYREVTLVIKESAYSDRPLWMGEFGDLEQSGEREWYVAWVMAARLFDHLYAGFSASLVWDAYDNIHDHDGAWTIYGLLRTGLRLYTPKKRYYTCKQVFRFIPPGFVRIGAEADSADVRVLAFANPPRTQITLVGMNLSGRAYHLNAGLSGFPTEVMDGQVTYYRTSAAENCHTIGSIPVRGSNYPFTGIAATIPPDCIFTLTTLKG